MEYIVYIKAFLTQLKKISQENKDKSIIRIWLGTSPLIVFYKAEAVEVQNC